MSADLLASIAARTGASVEPLKTKGRLKIEFKTPAQADAALALVQALGVGVSPPVAAPPPVGAVVATTAELQGAIAAAKPGEVILLAPGVFAALSLRNIRFASAITIRSQQPARPATLEGLTLRDCAGLVFTDMVFVAPKALPYGVQVFDGQHIGFDQVVVRGEVRGEPSANQPGMMIRSSSKVSVTGSEFYDLAIGISHLDCNGVKVTGSNFHDIRTDGVAGGGSSDVLISGNKFTDFAPVPGDHPDAVQFWFRGKVRDIAVTSNIITRGKGGPMQGVFITDQSGETPYEDVTITDNLILGGMGNGIMVYNADGLVLTGNTVAGFPDSKSWIRVASAKNATITDNQAQTYLIDEVDCVPGGNIRMLALNDGGAALLAQRAGPA